MIGFLSLDFVCSSCRGEFCFDARHLAKEWRDWNRAEEGEEREKETAMAIFVKWRMMKRNNVVLQCVNEGKVKK